MLLAALVWITLVTSNPVDDSAFCGLLTIQLPTNWKSLVGATTHV